MVSSLQQVYRNGRVEMAGRMHTVVTEGEAARLPEGFHRMASDDRVLLSLTASRGEAARLRQKLPEIALAGPTRRRKDEHRPLHAGHPGRAAIAPSDAGRPPNERATGGEREVRT